MNGMNNTIGGAVHGMSDVLLYRVDNNQWYQLRDDNIGGYGQIGISSPISMPSRRHKSHVSYSRASQQLIVFGGLYAYSSNNTRYNDLWYVNTYVNTSLVADTTLTSTAILTTVALTSSTLTASLNLISGTSLTPTINSTIDSATSMPSSSLTASSSITASSSLPLLVRSPTPTPIPLPDSLPLLGIGINFVIAAVVGLVILVYICCFLFFRRRRSQQKLRKGMESTAVLTQSEPDETQMSAMSKIATATTLARRQEAGESLTSSSNASKGNTFMGNMPTLIQTDVVEISFPAFLEMTDGEDFRALAPIGQGGFGSIWSGKFLNPELSAKYGTVECVVKRINCEIIPCYNLIDL